MIIEHRLSACRLIIMHLNVQAARKSLSPTLPGMNRHHQKKNSILKPPPLRPEPSESGAPMGQDRHLLCSNMQYTSRREQGLWQEPRLSTASATPALSTDQTDVCGSLQSVSISGSTTNRLLIPFPRTQAYYKSNRTLRLLHGCRRTKISSRRTSTVCRTVLFQRSFTASTPNRP